MTWAIPAGADLAALVSVLLTALAFVVLLGMLYAWDATFGAILRAIYNYSTIRVHIPGIYSHTFHLGNWAAWIDHFAHTALAQAASGCERAMGWSLHTLGNLWAWQTHELAGLAQDTWSLGHEIIHHSIPAALSAAFVPVRRRLNLLSVGVVGAAATAGMARHIARNAQKDASDARKRTRTIPIASPHTHRPAQTDAASRSQTIAQTPGFAYPPSQTDAANRAQTLAPTLPHITTIPTTTDWPVPFGRTLHQIKARLGKVEALLGATALAVAMANVLGVPSWRCLTKGPIGRVSRALCGMSGRALSDLLGLLADLFLITRICDVIALMEEGLSLIEGPINDLIAGADRMFVECGYDLPAHREPRTLYLPATVQTQLYLP